MMAEPDQPDSERENVHPAVVAHSTDSPSAVRRPSPLPASIDISPKSAPYSTERPSSDAITRRKDRITAATQTAPFSLDQIGTGTARFRAEWRFDADGCNG